MMMQPKMNLIILGDAAIGKTSVLRNVEKREFVDSHLKTIAVDFVLTEYFNEEDDRRIPVKIWDTAGQEKFRNITYQFYRQADGIMVGCDITNERSFRAINNWIQSIYKVKSADTPVVLFANKIDLEEERVVSKDDIQALAEQHKMNLHHTSAKTGFGVSEMVNDVLTQVYMTQIRPQLASAQGETGNNNMQAAPQEGGGGRPVD